jgi:hypothetical protein
MVRIAVPPAHGAQQIAIRDHADWNIGVQHRQVADLKSRHEIGRATAVVGDVKGDDRATSQVHHSHGILFSET